MKNLIKLFSLTLVMALVFVVVAPAALASDASDDNYLVIKATEVEAEIGDEVKVSLIVENNPGFAALILYIPETQGIEIVEVENGTVMATMTAGRNILWDSASNSTATGTLATITFRITDEAKLGENVISVNAFECYQEFAESVPVNTYPIIINVVANADQDTDETDGADDVTESATEKADVTESTTEDAKVTENDDTTADDEATTTVVDQPADKKGGCNSMISGGIFVFLLVPVAMIAIKRKDK
jgi:hypothetical protein